MILFLCDSIFTSTTINDDEIAERICERKFQTLLPWEYPQKSLPPAESEIFGEHFRMFIFNPKFSPHVIVRFGNEVNYDFTFNKHVWIVITSKDWAVLILIEDSNGALMISLNGDIPYCDTIEKTLFEKLRTSRWSCTAVPGSDFSKILESSSFVMQTHIKANSEGEKTYLRQSNEELEEQQVVSLQKPYGEVVKTTFGELCNGKKIMHKCNTIAALDFY